METKPLRQTLATIATLCLFPLAMLAQNATTQPSAKASSPKGTVSLGKPRTILKLDEKAIPSKRYGGLNMAKLSPTGTHLLYVRSDEVMAPPRGEDMPPRNVTIYEFYLRDLKTGKETKLPTIRGSEAEFANAVMTSFVFSADGKKLLLTMAPKGQENDVFRFGEKRMRLGLYDIEKAEAMDLNMDGTVVFGTFGPKRKSLILLKMDADGGRPQGEMQLRSIDKPDQPGKKLAKWGLVRGLCPKIDEIGLMTFDPAADRPELLFLNPQKDTATVVNGMVSRDMMFLSTVCPIFTPNGRYYCMLGSGGGGRDMMSDMTLKVYDRKLGKFTYSIGEMLPLGPGPRDNTVLAVKVDVQQMRNSGDLKCQGLFLIDATTGRTYAFGEMKGRPIAVQGKTLLYTSKNAAGDEVLHAAEIKVGKLSDKKMPVPTQPAATTGPAWRGVDTMPAEAIEGE